MNIHSLTIDDILRGTEPGRVQSVGHMQVVPLLGENAGDFAPPRVEISTTSYGTVVLRNRDPRPTIVPPGAGWIVKQAAQDHALGGGALLAGESALTIDTARCIQSSQYGMIRPGEHPMVVLPAALRAPALAKRKQSGCGLLWDAITAFNRELGVRAASHLEYFLRQFDRELARFVAEFELVPRQLGAVVLVGGQVVGIERAPSVEFWRAMWEPLIRVCYGSLAIAHARGDAPVPDTRVPLRAGAGSLTELRRHLREAEHEEQRRVNAKLDALRGVALRDAGEVDQRLDDAALHTLASTQLAGQIVRGRAGGPLRFASLATTGLAASETVTADTPSAVRATVSEGSPAQAEEVEAEASAQPPSWGARLRRWWFGVD